MTKEEMIALANQAGMSNLSLIDIGYLEAFANLILEKAAEIADSNGQDEPYGHAKFRCVNIAEAIRRMKK